MPGGLFSFLRGTFDACLGLFMPAWAPPDADGPP